MDTENISCEPIKIKLIKGKPLVWKANDWKHLQLNRIHGTLTGSVAGISKQASVNGLPMLLLNEEVTLMVEKKLGSVYTYNPTWKELPREEIIGKFKEYSKRNAEEQMECFINEGKRQISSRLDQIIEGKRRKLVTKKRSEGGGRELTELEQEAMEDSFDREKIFKVELEKKTLSLETNNPTLIQIPTVDPWMTDDDLTTVEWKYPETTKEKLRYRIFKDLWEKNYSITSGSKFGGDYLVYPGEPWRFHSFFVVVCVACDEPLPLRNILSKARISVFTRKNLVIATVDKDDNVIYQTFSWPTKKYK